MIFFRKPVPTFRDHALGLRLAGLGWRLRRRWRRKILFLAPARLDAGLHDQSLGLLLAEIEISQDAGVFDGLAVLALAPADQVVGDAAGQVLDRLEAVLAELHQHLGADAGNLFERILDAQLLARGVELGLFPVQELARARLQLLSRVLVEALDAGELLL